MEKRAGVCSCECAVHQNRLASAEAANADLTRKGKDLCNLSGSSLIQIKELEAENKRLRLALNSIGVQGFHSKHHMGELCKEPCVYAIAKVALIGEGDDGDGGI